MKRKVKEFGRRAMALMMALSMTMSSMSTAVFATGDNEIDSCNHHLEHTAECGYDAGANCGHLCTSENGCIVVPTECAHVHDENCGYVEAVEGVACACVPVEDSSVTHAENCGFVAAVEGVACGHVCDESCLAPVTVCVHQHDEACGYKEAKACQFVCEECALEDEKSEEAVSPTAGEQALTDMQALLEEAKAVDPLSEDALTKAEDLYERMWAAYDEVQTLWEEDEISDEEMEVISAVVKELDAVISDLEYQAENRPVDLATYRESMNIAKETTALYTLSNNNVTNSSEIVGCESTSPELTASAEIVDGVLVVTIRASADAPLGQTYTVTVQWRNRNYYNNYTTHTAYINVTIVDPRQDVLNKFNNDTYPVYLAVRQNGEIPGEPSVQGSSGYSFFNSNYSTGGTSTFADNAAGIIDTSIVDHAQFFFTSVDGTRTVGMVDGSGHVIQEAVTGVDWNDLLDAVAANGNVKATNNITVTSQNKSQYKIVPYVIKLQETDGTGWHIDCAVVPIDYVILSYDINLPDGAVIMTNNVGVPNAQTSAKDNQGQATFDVSAMMIGTRDPIDVGETIIIAYNGRTYDITFKGWNTQADMRGTYYYPNQEPDEITISADTTLYAVWTAENYGELRIDKTIATPNGVELTDEQKNTNFTFRISLSGNNIESSYAYGVYNADHSRHHYGTWSNNGTIVLRHGQYAIFEGLPASAEVEIEETGLSSDYGTPTWTYKKVQNNTETAWTTDDGAFRIIGAARVVASCTNTFAPKTSVTVTKVWNDNNNVAGLRPDSITVNLLNGSNVVDSVVLSDNKQSHTFEGLDVSGVYTVAEAIVPQHYTAVVSGDATSGFTITNTLETVDVVVSKKWIIPTEYLEDTSTNHDSIWDTLLSNNNKELTAKIRLLKNGQPEGYPDQELTFTVSSNNTGDAIGTATHTWTNLPKYENGQEIPWTVIEVFDNETGPSHYWRIDQTSSTEDNTQTVLITNTYDPIHRSAVVDKKWDDAVAPDLRPSAVYVQLWQSTDGEHWTKVENNDNAADDGVVELNAGNNWQYVWTQLDQYEDSEHRTENYWYKVTELVDSDSSVEKYYTVQNPSLEAGTIGENIFSWVITNTLNTTTINVEKQWVGTPASGPVTVNVMNGSIVAGTISLTTDNSGEWKGSITLPAGPTYTVVEDGVDTDNKVIIGGKTYQVTTVNNENTWTITNTELRDITVTKVWNDRGFEQLRPDSVTVTLYNGNVATEKTLILESSKNWTNTFENLPVDGSDYSVKENGTQQVNGKDILTLPSKGIAYVVTSEKTANGFTITNSIQKDTATVDIHITKAWLDEGHENERPTITAVFDVYRRVKGEDENWTGVGQAEYSYTVTPTKADSIVGTEGEDHIRYHRITGLPKFDANGNEYEYMVEEAVSEIEDMYRAEVKEVTDEDYMDEYDYVYVATNTLRSHLVIEKVWDDGDDQDDKRPDSVTITLYADGQAKDVPIILTAKDNALENDSNTWRAVVNDLPFSKISEDGHVSAIEYTIKENNIPDGYSVAYSNDTTNIEIGSETINGVKRFTATNSYTPETVNIAVEKVWKTANGGSHPSSVTVQLCERLDGNVVADEKVSPLTLSSSNNWEGSFDNLPKKRNGVDIDYIVKETYVAGYTDSAEAVSGGYIITNTQDTASITVNKVWEDNNNQDGKRPTAITIKLIGSDGTTRSRLVQNDESGKWEATFDGLPMYTYGENGAEEIEYTVTEDAVTGYTSAVAYTNSQDSIKFTKDNRTGTATITNSYTPETTSVTVTKQWIDGNNQDGKRPDSITVNLLADGQYLESKTLNLNNNSTSPWTGVFSNLPKYKDGKEIAYTVEEQGVINGKVSFGGAEYNVSVTGSVATGYTITNTHTPETVTVSGKKMWEDNSNQDGVRPASIWVRVVGKVGDEVVQGATKTKEIHPDGADPTTNLEGQANTPSAQAVIDNEWNFIFENLPKYHAEQPITYTVEELTAENGEKVEGDTKLNGKYSATYDNDEYTITNTYDPEKTSVAVSKTWSIDTTKWSSEFGSYLNPTGESQQTSLTATIRLLKDGVQYDEKSLKAENITNSTTEATGKLVNAENKEISYILWDNLPKFRDGGIPIDWTIVEVFTADKPNLNWTIKNESEDVTGDNQITGKEIAITNTFDPIHRSAVVDKHWVEDRDEGLRPSQIKVRLWQGTPTACSNLDQKITEEEVRWVPVKDAQNISDDNTSVSWGNLNGVPQEIKVTVGSNETTVDGVVELSADNSWQHIWSVLPQYVPDYDAATDKDNPEKAYWYKVQEIDDSNVTGHYTVSYSASGSGIFAWTITNTREEDDKEVNISVNKVWADGSNQDGKRPNEAIFNLIGTVPKNKDGEEVLTTVHTVHHHIKPGETGVDVSDDGNQWSYTFENLPKYALGQQIQYTVQEVGANGQPPIDGTLNGYTVVYDYGKSSENMSYDCVQISEENTGSVTVTNKHTPETVTISGTKTWAGDENYTDLRPAHITVNLYKNGEKVIYKTAVTDANNNWEYEFTELPKYAGGQEIVYTVAEEPVNGYTSVVNGFNITNTYDPPYIPDGGDDDNDYDHDDGEKVIVKKVWVDGDGNYPDVEIQLYKNGRKYRDPATLKDSKITSKNWRYVWEDVSEDEDTVWSVKEINVPAGYRSDVTKVRDNYFIVTNTWVEEKPNPGTGAN